MPAQEPGAPESPANLVYKELHQRLRARFEAVAINGAVIDLHTRPSLIGKLRMPGPGQGESTHKLLNICFLHAALQSPRVEQEAAFRLFSSEAQHQGLELALKQIRADVRDVAQKLRRHEYDPPANDDGPSASPAAA